MYLSNRKPFSTKLKKMKQRDEREKPNNNTLVLHFPYTTYTYMVIICQK